MKKLLFLLSIIFLFTQCDTGTVGKGNIISEKREVAAFHAISSDAVAEITLIQDTTTSIEIKGYENIVPLMLTSVENGELTIETKSHIRILGKPHLEVIIHVLTIDKLELQGVGSINSQGNFNFKEVKMQLSGVGSINVSGQATKAELITSGAGSIHCKNLLSDTTIATTSGVGSIQCNAIKYLRAIVSGVGSISYTGDPVVEKSVSGVGSVNKE
jgi:Putative auto-transporter adhesin, head GIN domain